MKIKPCPFCGSNGKIAFGGKYWPTVHYYDYMRKASCKNIKCGAVGPERKTEQGAINAWNNRVESPYEIIVYSAEADDEYGGILRMALHPMEDNPPLHCSSKDEPDYKFPFRVVYTSTEEEDCECMGYEYWQYSCRGTDVAVGLMRHSNMSIPYAGRDVGDGSIDAAIAWLLEGEK